MMAYLQALLYCSRYMILTQHTHQPMFQLPLASLYIQPTIMSYQNTVDLNGSFVTNSSIADLVRPSRARIMLHGASGSGKHMLLHWLTLVCATQLGIVLDEVADSPLVWVDDVPIPLLIDCRRVVPMLRKQRYASMHLPLQEVLHQQLEQLKLSTFWPTLQQALAQGSGLVLVHGFDSIMSDAARRTFLTAFAQFVEQYPHNRFVIACRYPAQLVKYIAGFSAYTLDMLDADQQEQFITRWVNALALQALPTSTSITITHHIARLHHLVRYDPHIRQLAPLPVALASLVVADMQGVPPERLLAAVGASVTTWMLDRDHPSDAMLAAPPRMQFAPMLGTHADASWSYVLPLAFALQSRIAVNAGSSLSRTDIHRLLYPMNPPARAATTLSLSDRHTQLYVRNGILAVQAHNSYHIQLPYVRTYLAAVHLAQLPDFVARAYGYLHQSGWREVLDVAMQLVAAQRADVYEELLQVLLATPSHAMIVARYLRYQRGASPLLNTMRERAREHLLTLIEAESSSTHTRVEAGTLLGHLGHPALGSVVPPMIVIDGGPFLFGNTPDGYPDEGPQRKINLSSFAIGTYPVTNDAYARFLADQPATPQPRYWHDPRFNNPAQPVVGITWHEAVAYTVWLTAYMERHGLLPDNRVVRLPLEVEWEKAASWDWQQLVKRRYPWGNHWEPGRANTAETRDGWVITPIGCYPQGASAYGVQDLVGNVWEWMANDYASYPGATMAFHEPNEAVLRGSSCVSNAKHARCTYRGHLARDYWRYHLGFRVVLARPIKEFSST